ncbi:MAG: hypothetical protein AABX99_04225 [Nanoarchaeota archaeon]
MDGYYSSLESDETFYKLIKLKREEIKSFEISESEKDRLYHIVDETIQRYEEQKQIDLKGSAEHLGIAFQEMYKGLARLFLTVEKSLPLLRDTVVNMQITVCNMKYAGGTLDEILKKERAIGENLKETEKNLRFILEEKNADGRDIDKVQNKANDINLTVGQIIRNMRHQKK